MQCSLSSFFASAIAVSILVVLLYVLLQRNQIMSRFGVGCFYLAVILVLTRGYLPLNFCGRLTGEVENGHPKITPHLTKTYPSDRLLPFLSDLFQRTLFSAGGISITLNKIFLAVWAAGVIVFLWKQISGYFSCKKELMKMPKVKETEILDVFHKTFQRVFPGKENQCVVMRSDLFGSAAVFGIRKPIVVLTNAEYSNRELELVFCHELFHVKHKDYLWKSLCVVLAAVHWWNPVISRLLPKIMAQAQELLVDYCVTKGLKPEEKLCYLECIQKTVKHAAIKKSQKISVAALGSGGKKRDILQRFQLIIAQNARGYNWKNILIGCLLFVLSFTFVFEQSIKPEYDEYGNEVFYCIEGNSYYIKSGEKFDLYLNGRYIYTADKIVEDFKGLPIYKEGEK